MTPSSVARALSMLDIPSRYVLGAGGRSPDAEVPFTVREGKLGSDCIGFVLWCWGVDRYQPVDGKGIEFGFYGGWINTDSLLMDATGPAAVFEVISPEHARPGDAVVYPSLWANGQMVRMGHIGLIVALTDRASCSSQMDFFARLEIVDCAAATKRKISGHAIARRSGSIWNLPDAKIVRLKTPAPLKTPIPSPPVMALPKLGDRVLTLAQPYMQGPDVAELQKRLKVKADGVFGTGTYNAVRNFQFEHGLAIDGIVGPETARTLAQ